MSLPKQSEAVADLAQQEAFRRKHMKFILASKSPRRRSLLENIGLKFDIMESTVDESVIPKDLSPNLYVQELALLKSSSVAAESGKGHLVIGADTVVVYDGKIIGKPKDFDEAFEMLSSFSGKAHTVYSGICVTDSTTMRSVTDYCATEVYFSTMSCQEITDYINTYKPFDKAGAYGIQEYAGVFIDRIDGDFFNVVGLPLSKLYRVLKKEFDVII